MFDEILKMVKEHLGNNSELTSTIPDHQVDAVHTEIANHLANTLTAQPADQGVAGGLIGKLESAVASGGPITNAIEGGLVSSLASKFGLPPSVTGAIAASLPGLLQKFKNRQ